MNTSSRFTDFGLWFLTAMVASAVPSGLWLFDKNRPFAHVSSREGMPAPTAEPIEPSHAFGVHDYTRSIEGLDSQQLCERLREDFALWSVSPNRVTFASRAFAQLAKKLGAKGALNTAIGLASTAKLAPPERALLVSTAALGAFAVHAPAREELVSLLREAGSEHGRPILEAYAPSLPFSAAGDIANEILALMQAAGWKINGQLESWAVAVAVSSADDSDPAQLATFVLGEEKRIKGNGLLGLVLMHLGQSRPGAASQLCLALGLRLAAEFGATDPGKLAQLSHETAEFIHLSPKALREITAALPGSGRSLFLARYLANTVKSPLDFAAIADEFPASELSTEAAANLASGLLSFGGGRVTAWLTGLDQGERAKILNRCCKPPRSEIVDFTSWSNVSGKSLSWIEAAKDVPGVDPEAFSTSILQAASAPKANGPELMALCDRLPPVKQKEAQMAVYSGIFNRIGNNNAAGLRAAVDAAPAALRAELLADAAGRLSYDSPDDALSWFQESTDPAEKHAIQVALLAPPPLAPGGISLETRLAWMNELANDPSQAEAVTRPITAYVTITASSDALGAADFVDHLPPSPVRDQAVAALAQAWSQHDPTGASDWITQMPAGPARDAALGALVQNSRDAPEAALANAAAIGDPNLRLKAAAAVLDFWQTADPATANASLAAAPLSDEDKAALAKSLSSRQPSRQ